jgi:hypothetical protein
MGLAHFDGRLLLLARSNWQLGLPTAVLRSHLPPVLLEQRLQLQHQLIIFIRSLQQPRKMQFPFVTVVLMIPAESLEGLLVKFI